VKRIIPGQPAKTGWSQSENASDDANYDRKESSMGEPYFNLKAANHQVIGTSEIYSSAASQKQGN
jgi:uncharacterized protein YegP (UPF0339 family)